MNASSRTEARRPRPTDEQLATAYRDLEPTLMQARDAVVTAEIVFEDAGNPGEFGEELKRRVPGWGGYKVLVLTEEQFTALHYVMRCARDEADELRKRYYAGFGHEVPA